MRILTAGALVLLWASSSVLLVQALFEDQVGKFDWRELNVGIPESARFWETSKDAAIITGTKNVLAALDADSGKNQGFRAEQKTKP